MRPDSLLDPAEDGQEPDEAVFPVSTHLARGHHADGAIAGAATQSAMPAIDTARAGASL
jgi:hypothetical protein